MLLAVVRVLVLSLVWSATQAATAPRSYVTDQAVYHHFELMFGPALRHRVQSSISLQGALRDLASSPTSGSPLVLAGCSSYVNGAIIGRAVRRSGSALVEKTRLKMFLVSRRENLACFMYRWLPNDLLSKMKFSAYPIPSLLRVHPFLYSTVDRLSRLTKLVRPLSTVSESAAQHAEEEFHLHIIPFVGDTTGLGDAMTIVSSLKAYDMRVFEGFYWSSSRTATFLSTQSLGAARESHREYTDTLSLELDSQRSKTWGRLSTVLRQFTPTEGIDTLTVVDPCSLARLEPRISLGKITLPVSHLLNHQNPQIGAACLSYIVAHLTQGSQSPVFSVGLLSTERLLNNNARSIVQGSGVGSSFQTYTEQSLVGSGQVVQLADTGVDQQSCYFADPNGNVNPSDSSGGNSNINVDNSKRKIVSYVYVGSSGDQTDMAGGHGTHVAGTIAGNFAGADITSTGQYDGVAPGAQLAVMDLASGSSEALAIPGSADALFGPGYSAGARLHSMSWGSFFAASDTGYYSASDMDDYLYNHQDSTVFFAAGNSGDVGNAVSMQGQAKNVVAVGSSETTRNSVSIENVAYYSSFGPAYDGRYKPDIVCPGDELKSAKSQGDGSKTCGTLNKSGTSQATPVCAGTAALVRQYFSDPAFWESFCASGTVSGGAGCAAFEPSGVLVKAVMVHSGTPLSLYHYGDTTHDRTLGPPPDNTQGFGRVTLKNVLPLPGHYDFNLFVDDKIALGSGESVSYAIDIVDSSTPLKLTLVWYDPPNQDGITTPALLHDLDLEVTGPAGERLVGNGENSGNSAFDTLNTNEMVWAANPSAGAWTATVSARSLVAADSQKFSLVITLHGTVNGGGGGGGGGGSAPAPGPSPTATDDYQKAGEPMIIRPIGAGGNSGSGSGSAPAFGPSPISTDDYQKPGEPMIIRPIGAGGNSGSGSGSAPAPGPSPISTDDYQKPGEPMIIRPSSALTVQPPPSEAKTRGFKKGNGLKLKETKLNKKQRAEAEALSVDWVQVVHSDDGDPRNKQNQKQKQKQKQNQHRQEQQEQFGGGGGGPGHHHLRQRV